MEVRKPEFIASLKCTLNGKITLYCNIFIFPDYDIEIILYGNTITARFPICNHIETIYQV